MKTYEAMIGGCVVYATFVGGVPGNGPLMFSEDYKEELASALGIASLGKSLAALTMGPLAFIAKNQANGVQIYLWTTGGISLFWISLWILEGIVIQCKDSSPTRVQIVTYKGTAQSVSHPEQASSLEEEQLEAAGV